ncbi:MAG: zinc ribbon domain-containing protein [Candidatus Rokubacteria bacterium]|nr:zinc ribbon domain-containing protein [Candidatus Rokubacteria bacterium]
MPKYEFLCESCKKSFDVVLTAAERATAKVQCPGCGSGEVTPQIAMFSAKTSRKS